MPFAGLVALGEGPLHADWQRAWPEALSRRGWAARVRVTPTAVLLDWSTVDRCADCATHCPGHDEPVVVCDARIDAPAIGSDGTAAVLASQLDAAHDGAPFDVEGEFAFARWNPMTRQLLLACDAVGSHPLYVARYGACTAFSTDLPMLLALPGMSRRLDEVRLVDQLLATGATPIGSTCYLDIRQVPSGTQWRLGGGACAPSALTRRPVELSPGGRDDAAAHLRALIEDAIHCRLDERVVAVHLSGGLDSSAIACVAARRLRQQGRRLLALCTVLPPGLPGPENDERRHIEAVLAQEDNIDPVWIPAHPAQAGVFDALPRWFEALGCPPLNNATHPLDLLGAAGRAHGARTVLNGFGGDLFASSDGSGTVMALLRHGQWRHAWNDLQTQRRIRGWKPAIRRELLAPVRARFRRRAPPLSNAVVRQDVLEPLLSGSGYRIDGARQRVATMGPHELMHELVRAGHLDYPVSNMVQFLSRAHGQDLRLPLLDLRIVEFMQRVPLHELQRGGLPRSLFRRAIAGLVPESVRLRPDKGPAFDPAVMSRIVASADELRAWANDDARPCWKFLDRHRFLAALAQVRPAARHHWRGDTFLVVMMGGSMGKFIDWHAAMEAARWE